MVHKRRGWRGLWHIGDWLVVYICRYLDDDLS